MTGICAESKCCWLCNVVARIQMVWLKLWNKQLLEVR